MVPSGDRPSHDRADRRDPPPKAVVEGFRRPLNVSSRWENPQSPPFGRRQLPFQGSLKDWLSERDHHIILPRLSYKTDFSYPLYFAELSRYAHKKIKE